MNSLRLAVNSQKNKMKNENDTFNKLRRRDPFDTWDAYMLWQIEQAELGLTPSDAELAIFLDGYGWTWDELHSATYKPADHGDDTVQIIVL